MAFLRRAGLVLGLTLLATGWGLLQYAEAQQRVVADGRKEAISLWAGERTSVGDWLNDRKHLSGKTLAVLGIIGMGSGAAIATLAFTAGRRYDPGP